MRLTRDNFVVFCMHHYDNPHCSDIAEFEEDLRRLRALKKLFKRYKLIGELRERIILNQIIVMYNLFGSAATDIMYHKLEEYADVLIPFISFLNKLPKEIYVNNTRIVLSEIKTDPTIEPILSSL